MLPCVELQEQPVPGQSVDNLLLVTNASARVKFTPKAGASFKITQHGSYTYEVIFTGFCIRIGGNVVHGFVINSKTNGG